jgi:Spy/CpxP family protein refolding chaperone
MTRLYHVGIVLFMLFFALLAIPETGQANRMRSSRHGIMMGMDMSELSAEEQKVVQDLMQKHHGQMVDMHKKIFPKRAELNAAMAQEKFDSARARTLAKEVAAMESNLMQRKLGMLIEMRGKGVSYYGTCIVGGRMGPCMMGGGTGAGMKGRHMMMGGDMIESVQE